MCRVGYNKLSILRIYFFFRFPLNVETHSEKDLFLSDPLYTENFLTNSYKFFLWNDPRFHFQSSLNRLVLLKTYQVELFDREMVQSGDSGNSIVG